LKAVEEFLLKDGDLRYHPTLEGAKQLIKEAKAKMKSIRGEDKGERVMRYFSLYSETEEIDHCGDEVVGSRWLVTSDNIQNLFKHVEILIKEDRDWVFKIVRDAEDTE
jgi:hypothetical protein